MTTRYYIGYEEMRKGTGTDLVRRLALHVTRDVLHVLPAPPLTRLHEIVKISLVPTRESLEGVKIRSRCWGLVVLKEGKSYNN